MRVSRISTWLAATVIYAASAASQAEIVVIVNPKNAAASLTAEQVAELYLGSKVAFPDGSRPMLTDQPEGSSMRGDFYQKAAGRTTAQVKATWARLVFTGKGTPPKELQSDAEVKAFVAKEPGAIGYVDAKAVDASVKSVLKLQ